MKMLIRLSLRIVTIIFVRVVPLFLTLSASAQMNKIDSFGLRQGKWVTPIIDVDSLGQYFDSSSQSAYVDFLNNAPNGLAVILDTLNHVQYLCEYKKESMQYMLHIIANNKISDIVVLDKSDSLKMIIEFSSNSTLHEIYTLFNGSMDGGYFMFDKKGGIYIYRNYTSGKLRRELFFYSSGFVRTVIEYDSNEVIRAIQKFRNREMPIYLIDFGS